MPYIKPEDRKRISIDVQIPEELRVPGTLNYVLTFIIKEYLKRRGINYTTLNEVVGVLEQVKDELQRRVIHPYEDDLKMKENGDVY